MSGGRYALAGYQARALEALTGVIRKVSEYHNDRPQQRKEIALKSGVTLLQAPTGSGKTLVLGRTLEGLRGALSRPVVWFWFAPYAGLVTQTRDAIVDQCGSLRVRDISKDREPVGTRDGDVFVQTWSAVAANNKDARKVRRTKESALSLDDMIETLRDDGFFVGVVIDEAHLNFGASAKAAADFYLNALKPDFTVLATATPNDDKLEAFEDKAGIEVASRVIVPRGDVVDAGLNKEGLMMGVIRMSDADRDLVDHEQATLTAGWTQHQRVKARLAERGISLTPLMLVQVEDQAAGGEDPVDRVREKLIQDGVPEGAIATHTSGQPDPDFHTLAYDPDKEVLIFKVAVATGFDAPRAWTLVSVRPNRGKEFGLQIVGRIMRVHPLVRPFHGQDSLLDRGYVFLTDPEMQAGLDAAVEEVKAVRQSIELITDRLDLVELSTASKPLAINGFVTAAQINPSMPSSEEDRETRISSLIEAGFVKPDAAALPAAEQDRAIVAGERWQQMTQTPLFGDLPETDKPDRLEVTQPKPEQRAYPLRTDLDLPKGLWRELPPNPAQADQLVDDIAKIFCNSSNVVSLLQKRKTKATMSLSDLFVANMSEEVDLRLRLSNARVAEKAQMAFNFNDTIDPRLLKRALINELRHVVDDQGIEAEERDLRRALDMAVMGEPGKLKDAMKIAQGRNVRLSNTVPIPDNYMGPHGLQPAEKSAYGVFPARLNQEEQKFAEVLDQDGTGTVLWWMRNPENESWATRIVLPSGKNFFPDFIVGVAGRATPNAIALVEIKDDGDTGRLQSDRNIDKIRVQHREYRKVFWTYRDSGEWVRAGYAERLHRIVLKDVFSISEMVFLE
ncbi:DEAD/DEAH box helicase family protein [Loktanella sp. TSTF-M6]|uniref:DEAD/DEAH box helicase family protein n=1 Tax=Loktanella gaetbuli TaxID=2881335 RepID=A0ABS8BS69_9RHOB|nr:DEAD/DEAH box helicase family protein [Loktanella gaetbuli]MCB5198563.1 DEAD/DEAH box helicase family protein [Loktanella gaetbuli]